MPGKVNLTFADYGGEKSSFSLFTQVFNAANFNANDLLVTNLITALNAIVDGLLVKDQRIYSEAGTGQGASAIPTAQREAKWLITFQDNTTQKRYQREIPCPLLDATTILAGVGGNANLTDAKWIAFIDAFEQLALSEDGNAVTFISARHVGRNN